MTAHSQEFEFSEHDFHRVRAIVADRLGIKLADSKRELVYGRLARRLRALELKSFREYCERLADGDGEEFEHFTNAITTNLTSFFREPHHFDYLRERIIPGLGISQGRAPRVRIWSAGCSSGEEPYSIAMTLAEAAPPDVLRDVRILATDLDSSMVRTASAAIYPQSRVADMARQSRDRWFLRGTGAQAGKVRVREEIARMVAFRRLNLMEAWPMRGPFDVIFCRNVIIYFSKDTQRGLMDRFANLLAAGGHLFIGHSESLFSVTTRFRPVGKTIYRKVS